MDPMSIDHFIFFSIVALLSNYLWWVMPAPGSEPELVWGFRVFTGIATIGGLIYAALAGIQ